MSWQQYVHDRSPHIKMLHPTVGHSSDGSTCCGGMIDDTTMVPHSVTTERLEHKHGNHAEDGTYTFTDNKSLLEFKQKMVC